MILLLLSCSSSLAPPLFLLHFLLILLSVLTFPSILHSMKNSSANKCGRCIATGGWWKNYPDFCDHNYTMGHPSGIWTVVQWVCMHISDVNSCLFPPLVSLSIAFVCWQWPCSGLISSLNFTRRTGTRPSTVKNNMIALGRRLSRGGRQQPTLVYMLPVVILLEREVMHR